jgi:hypothetical protein
VSFPRATFDIVEMQVEFPSDSTGRMNPKLHVSAHTDLEPGLAGNEAELPIDLVIEGGLDQMNLDLVANDAGHEWTRAELLALIVLGRSLQSSVTTGDLGVAVRALSHELTAAFTQEVEGLAQETLGVHVQLDLTGWRWQMGRRLSIEGPGLLSNLSVSSDVAATSSVSSTSTPTGDPVRLRLLIFDHLPVGRDFAFEGRSYSTSQNDLRLSYRLFEE